MIPIGPNSPVQRRRIYRRPLELPPDNRVRPLVKFILVSACLSVVFVIILFAPKKGNLPPQAAIPMAKTPADELSDLAKVTQLGGGSPTRASAPTPTPKSVAERWGIEITGLRLTMGGNGLDLRYKVTDPAKATNLLHLLEYTYVRDTATGKILPLPLQRENHTSQKLVAGRTYFALLSNKDHLVKSGSKVTVAIGTSWESNMTVE